MTKKFLIAIAAVIFLLACGSDIPDSKNQVAVGEKEWKKVEGGKPADELAANAIKDSDVLGKVKWSLQTLQEAYNSAAGKVPNVGKVTVLVDDNLTLTVKNELDGKVYESKANLLSLDPVTSHLGIIPDRNPGEFPGLKVHVLEGKTKVEKWVDGSLRSKEDHLEIILTDRTTVQRVASAMMNAVQAAHGKL